jgi:hypothetical protein
VNAAIVNPDCDCQQRECECGDATSQAFSLDGKERMVYAKEGYMIAAFRVCLFCEEEFELEGQPTDDPRQFCDKTCALSERGEL